MSEWAFSPTVQGRGFRHFGNGGRVDVEYITARDTFARGRESTQVLPLVDFTPRLPSGGILSFCSLLENIIDSIWLYGQ